MCILHAQRHSLFDFRVGVRAGREVSVRLLLFLDHGDVGVAHLLQGAGHGLQAGAIQRAVHNGHVLVDLFAKQDGLALDLLHECGITSNPFKISISHRAQPEAISTQNHAGRNAP